MYPMIPITWPAIKLMLSAKEEFIICGSVVTLVIYPIKVPELVKLIDVIIVLLLTKSIAIIVLFLYIPPKLDPATPEAMRNFVVIVILV